MVKRMLFIMVLAMLAVLPAVAATADNTGWAIRELPLLFIVFGAALTIDRITQKKERGVKSYPVAASKIYAGSLVAINSAGYAVPASDTASLKVVGVALEQVDNSAGAAGDKSIKVEAPIVARFNATSITQAMVGQVVYVVDDNTFDDALGTNGIKAGRLVEFISTTEGWIEIEEGGAGVTNADAGATYTAAEQALINALKTAVNQRILG